MICHDAIIGNPKITKPLQLGPGLRRLEVGLGFGLPDHV